MSQREVGDDSHSSVAATEDMRARREAAGFRALVKANAYVIYRMSADWAQMLELEGQGFIRDAAGPYTGWLADYIHPDDQPQVIAAIQKAIATKSMFELEHRVRRVDGTLGWILSRAVPLFDDGEIVEWFGAASDVTDRKTAEIELRAINEKLEDRVAGESAARTEAKSKLDEAESAFRTLVQGVTDYAIYTIAPDGTVMTWNAGAERIKGYRAEEIVGRNFSNFYTPEDQATDLPRRALATAAHTGRFEAEGWRVRKDGSRFWASVVIDAIRDENGVVTRFAKVTRDLTERRAAEEQMRQSQKMEAIGQLTGGVAHDFNNLLHVISGNIETLHRRLSPSNPDVERLLSRTLQAAERAAVLTHRLLAFSRRQPLDPKPVEINRIVIGMSDLLERTIGEQIKIQTILSGGMGTISVDPNQLENAVINLAVNARDAMPSGGKLTIETANIELDENYAAVHDEVTPGQYVMLAISDTGHGMPREVLEKAFEPFFTTKRLGEGTGLGLSQVYGFVKQSGGHIKLYSEPGEGTTVRLYFPRIAEAETNPAKRESSSAVRLAQEGETILVVEDDNNVLAHTTGILRELGYTVLEAHDGDSALSLIATEPRIELLFTDIGLPGPLNGRQLADEARRRRPDLKVLFTTGYARNAIVHGGKLDPGVSLIVKPYTFAALAAKVRLIFD